MVNYDYMKEIKEALEKTPEQVKVSVDMRIAEGDLIVSIPGATFRIIPAWVKKGVDRSENTLPIETGEPVETGDKIELFPFCR